MTAKLVFDPVTKRFYPAAPAKRSTGIKLGSAKFFRLAKIAKAVADAAKK